MNYLNLISMENIDVAEVLIKNGFYLGRLMAGSKSLYRKAYPDNFAVFNANIITDNGKIWYGDIDVTLDEPKLLRIAKETDTDLYILREMDCRFEHENDSVEIMKSKAVAIITKSGAEIIIKTK